MNTIYVIVGLPGSGKTHYGRELLSRLLAKGRKVALYDDLSINKEASDAFEAHDPDKDVDIIIADVFLCSPMVRMVCEKHLESKFPLAEIKWVFFENNPVKCHENVKSRTGSDRKVDNMIDTMTRQYYIPPNSQEKTIWQKT